MVVSVILIISAVIVGFMIGSALYTATSTSKRLEFDIALERIGLEEAQERRRAAKRSHSAER